MEDVIRLLLPICGFFVCVVNLLILSITQRLTTFPSLLRCCAYIDLLTGISMIASGIEQFSFDVTKIQWYDPNVFLWDFVSLLQIIMIICFAINRFVNSISPYKALRIFEKMNSRRYFIALIVMCLLFTFVLKAFLKKILIYLNAHFGNEVHSIDIDFWLHNSIFIASCIGSALSGATILILIIRFTRKTWSFFIKRNCDNHITISILCFGRSIFFLLSEMISFDNSKDLQPLVMRVSYMISITLFTPIILIIFFPSFIRGIRQPYDKYKIPKIHITDDNESGNKEYDSKSKNDSSVWSTGQHFIGQLDFEHHETKAERERSISFYRDVRCDNAALLHKLNVAGEKRKLARRSTGL